MQAGPLHRVKSGMDHVAGRGDEQHAKRPRTAAVGDLFDRVEVEDRLLDRDRDEVLDLERERLTQLLHRHPRQVDLADDDLLVRDAEDDLLRAELRGRPQVLDGVGDELWVGDLTVAHRTCRQRDLTKSLQRRRALAERELGRPDTGRTDVETNRSPSCHWFVLLYPRAPERSALRVLSPAKIGTQAAFLKHKGGVELRQTAHSGYAGCEISG